VSTGILTPDPYPSSLVQVYPDLPVPKTNFDDSAGVPVVLKFLKFQKCPEIVLKFEKYAFTTVCVGLLVTEKCPEI